MQKVWYRTTINSHDLFVEAILMGEVLLVYKISVEDQDKLETVHERLKKIKNAKYDKSQIEDLVFGIKVIKISFIIPDKVDGAMPRLEDEINSIPDITNVENEGTTLL
jgi:translation elongation factor EF-1beta